MIYHLKLKTQKVQNFIFKVPKLKTILGANSLLGEFFAVELPELRNNHEKYQIPKCWKEYCANLKEKDLPKWQNDDIYANFKKGVICSAWGHFETLFKTRDQAKSFIKDVNRKANHKIPGVSLSFFLASYSDLPKYYSNFEKKGKIEPISINTSKIHIDNPYFYPSSEDGENPQFAEPKFPEGKGSIVTEKIKEKGREFYKGNASDYLSIILKEVIGENVEMQAVFENDLAEFRKISLIPDNNKIAIIAIDGNAMGKRFNDECDSAKDKYKASSVGKETFAAMLSFEKFWFKQRNTFRKALKQALNSIDIHSYKNYNDNGKKYKRKLPYQIMMLGGDDLLLITVPEIAFDLVNNFANKIEKESDSLMEKGKISQEITISAGIAFVNSSFPFSQGHELAESLLSSAKVKSRVWEEGKKTPKKYLNTLDWHVHFPTGTEEIDVIRQKNYMLQYNDKTEILTRRPYTIEEAYKVWEDSKDLYKSFINKDNITDDEFENSPGRNKYKRLRTLLKTGKRNAELCSKILKSNKENGKAEFKLDINYHPQKNKTDWIKGHQAEKNNYAQIVINIALDVIELMDFHKRENKTREADNESR